VTSERIVHDAERVAYDVAILGGGPAGSAAALALVQVRPKLRVALVEPSAFDGWRIGETLAPGGRQLLEGLGCWERVRAAGAVESHGTIACWGGDAPYENEFLFSARGSAWHLDRAGFDGALLDTVAAAGVEVRRGPRFTAASREPDGTWALTLAHGAARDILRAAVVIDATGRAAAFASRAGAQRAVDDELIGVAVMLRFDGADSARDTRTLVEAQRDGWWYSAAIPGDRVVVAWMSDADLVRHDDLKEPQRWLDHVRATQFTRARIDACTPEWPVRIWSARSQRLRDVCGEGWIAIGDAASAFDPLSSAGVVKALYSGKLGAFAVLDLLGGVASGFDRYRQYVEREYAEYLTTRSHFYGREHRWRDSAFWTRRANGLARDGN
jgi:flavin-dependent dehydrogenase